MLVIVMFPSSEDCSPTLGTLENLEPMKPKPQALNPEIPEPEGPKSAACPPFHCSELAMGLRSRASGAAIYLSVDRV